MEAVLPVPALEFGDETYDVADLVLAGLSLGEWQSLEEAVLRGVGLEAEYRAAIAAVEVEEALAAFRYERRLIAAVELREWLAERSLHLRDVQGVLRRRLLRERFADVRSPAVDSEAGAEVMWAEAICSGVLVRCAALVRSWHAARAGLDGSGAIEPSPSEVEALTRTALAEQLAGLSRLGAEELHRRARRLVALHSEYEFFREGAIAPAAVAARVAERRLDWTTVSGSELTFELEGAARETRLHVTYDGCSLTDVAAMLGLEPVMRALDLAEAPKEISGELIAAREGELVGPWQQQDGWHVLQLERRSEPSPTDERVSARAREELLGELIERFSAAKAVDLVPL